MYVHSGLRGRIARVLCMHEISSRSAILCRLAFKGLCTRGRGSDNVQFVNSRMRSRQKMPLLQGSKVMLLSVI